MNSEQAKRIKIADYLYTLGFKPIKIQRDSYWYCSPLRDERTASFKVDNHSNIWYDHGTGEGGNILDFVMKLHSLHTISDALSHLSGKTTVPLPSDSSFFNSNTVFNESPSGIRILKVSQLTHPALFDYLNERRINIETAGQFCSEVYYTINGNSYFAVG